MTQEAKRLCAPISNAPKPGAHGGVGAPAERFGTRAWVTSARAERDGNHARYGRFSRMSSYAGKGIKGIESSMCSAIRGPTPRNVR